MTGREPKKKVSECMDDWPGIWTPLFSSEVGGFKTED
jgi:hypothetical protein